MKIFIRDIDEKGIEVCENMSEESLGLTPNDAIRFPQPLNIVAKISKTHDSVVSDFLVNGQYTSFCYRCLDAMDKGFHCHFMIDFRIEKHTEFVEMDEDIRQEIILNFPVRRLCREDCQGLCPVCGVNLNESQCACDREALHSDMQKPFQTKL